ncbi:hypothetical protein K438DRAFT_1885372 [Mycena galopus ATCC 62051]|nr:hypothetical protein K438DRAFT_1885372 [Mycena galopus ATCC 62051]
MSRSQLRLWMIWQSSLWERICSLLIAPVSFSTTPFMDGNHPSNRASRRTPYWHQISYPT